MNYYIAILAQAQMADFQLLVGFIAEPYLSSHLSCFLGREELKSVVKTDNLHYLWYRRFIIQLRNQELQAVGTGG